MKNVFLFICLFLILFGCLAPKKMSYKEILTNLAIQNSDYTMHVNRDSSFCLLKSAEIPGSGECLNLKIYDISKCEIIFDNDKSYHDAWWVSGFEIMLKHSRGVEITSKNNEISKTKSTVEYSIYNVKSKQLHKKNNL